MSDIDVPRKSRGKVIRVSSDVLAFMQTHRRRKETIDALMRRLFGLAPQKRKKHGDMPVVPEKRTFYIIQSKLGIFAYDDLKTAKEWSYRLGVRSGRKKPELIIPTLELK